MQYFPVFFQTDSIRVVIVGAGEVAARKIELLHKTHANIDVIAPRACDTVEKMAAEQQLHWSPRPVKDSDIDHCQLLFVCTNDPAVNAHLSELAKQRSIPVNVVDNPALCSFITPSIVDRDPLLIAISSGGAAPVLLRHLRQKLEAMLPARLSSLVKLADRFRDKVKGKFNHLDQRRDFWEKVFDGDVAETLLAGHDQQAEQLLQQQLDSTNNEPPQGCVYLIGAGPGDPELLTFKALRLMQKADLVVHDRLVSKEVLELVRRDARKVYVGKQASYHSVPQDQINQLLVTAARQGQRVVRLKGGDPYIFGRGGEEAQALVAAGIPFQAVPGITAAAGAGSYAGIPLTHRDHAQSVVFATGHLKDGTINLDWPALVQKNQTAVFYMGLTGLGIICQKLIEHGMSADMPIALVASATCENQQVVTGTLSNIEQQVEAAGIKPPALIIVGSVVTLRDQLK